MTRLASWTIAVLLPLAGVTAASSLAQVQAPPQGNDPLAQKKSRKSEEVLHSEGRLSKTDPIDKVRMGEKPPGSFHKVHECKMTPGKAYIIEMIDPVRAQTELHKILDPYLRLEDSTGKQLAVDDDSGCNQNARIVSNPGKDDNYRIIATTCE